MSTDLATIAGAYSTLAGVLAGFAFAGLVTLVAANVQGGTKVQHSLTSVVPLAGAFVGLVGSSLNYAIIAGEGSRTARATVLESIGGLGFAAAGIMLFYSLLVMLSGVHKDVAATSVSGDLQRVALFLQWLIVVGVSPALIFLMEGGIRDQEAQYYGLGSTAGPWYFSDYLAIILAAVLAVTGIVALIVTTRARKSASVAHSSPTSSTAIMVSALTVALTIITVIATTTVSLWLPEKYAGSEVEWVSFELVMTGYLICILVATLRVDIPPADKGGGYGAEN